MNELYYVLYRPDFIDGLYYTVKIQKLASKPCPRLKCVNYYSINQSSIKYDSVKGKVLEPLLTLPLLFQLDLNVTNQKIVKKHTLEKLIQGIKTNCKGQHIMFTYNIYNVSRALKLIPLALLNDSPFKSLFTHDRITAWNKLSQKIVNKLK